MAQSALGGGAPSEPGDGRTTPGGPGAASSLLTRFPYEPRSRLLRVTRIDELSPTMRRITVGGQALEHEFPWRRLGVTDHVRILLPDEATGRVDLPPPGQRPTGPTREYTIRAVDHAAHEVTFDFVLHEHGPAGRWAIEAGIGTELGVLGPRGSQVFPDSCSGYLLLADQTGLPALERFIEELPGTACVEAFVWAPEVAQRDLARPVTWLQQPTAVLRAVTEAVIGPDTFVWAAGEAGVVREIRTLLRDRHQADPAHVVARGYWRTGVVGPLSAEDR